MRDLKAIGDAVVAAVKAHVGSVANRQAALEQRMDQIPAGPRGETGAVGAEGPPGGQGIPGERGAQGEPGAIGPQGERGADGAVGAPGPAGEAGQMGLRGPAGNQGERGVEGAAGRDGRDGLPGLAGKDGAPGLNGTDGFGLEDFDMALGEDGRTLSLKFTRGEVAIERQVRLDTIIDRGVWRPAMDYEKGDHTSWDGSGWIAQRNTGDKPGTSDAWRLSTKRGRDGKDGKDGGSSGSAPAAPVVRVK